MSGIQSKPKQYGMQQFVGQKAIDVLTYFRYASPSKVFKQLGKFTLQGMSIG